MTKWKTLWQKEKFEQFLLLPLCYKKVSAAEASESVYMRERVKLRIKTLKI